MHLGPYIDENNLLRVEGCLKRAKLPQDITNPFMPPIGSYITILVISHYHTLSGHCGCGMTLTAIRLLDNGS